MVTPDLPAIAGWNRNMGIETILVAIKNTMTSSANRRLPQPSEGSTF